MRFQYFFLTVSLCTAAGLQAQYRETIVSDRPGQTFSPNTVGKGVLQFQQGVGYFSYHYSQTMTPPSGDIFEARFEDDNLLWDNQIRYGISERWEVDAFIAYRWSYFTFTPDEPQSDPGLNGGTDRADDFSNLGAGIRFNFLDGKDGPLTLAWLASANFYSFGYYEQSGFEYLDVRYMAALEFGDNNQLSSNIGYRGGNTMHSLLYTLNYSFNFSRFSTFVEMYGDTRLDSDDFDDKSTYLYFDFGATYLVCNALQLDVQAGFDHPLAYFRDITREKRTFFLGGGVSWRLKFY